MARYFFGCREPSYGIRVKPSGPETGLGRWTEKQFLEKSTRTKNMPKKTYRRSAAICRPRATAWPFPLEARMLPLIAGGAGAVLTGIIIVRSRPHPAPPNEMPTNPRPVPWRLLAMFAGYLATIPLIGALPASALYAALHCMVELRSSPWRAVSIAALVAVSIWVLFALWLRQPVFGAWL